MSTPQKSSNVENALLAGQEQQSVNDYISDYFRKVRSGNLGSLPIVFGLIFIAIIFQSQNSNFLTPRNMVGLIQQMAPYAAIGYGIVFVLLLGEIDLSVGYVSAVGGIAMVLLIRDSDMVWYLAIFGALCATTIIGLFQGFLITFFQVPSLVVTLAGFLVWSGAVLIMIGGAGTVIVQDRTVLDIASAFLPEIWGWILGVGFVALYAAGQYRQMIVRTAQGLPAKPMPIFIGQTALLLGIIVAVVLIANQDRGVPFVGVLLLVMMAILTYIAENTRFGRYVYAVGGNEEAARRAGIRVNQIKIIVFGIAGLMAGVGGIILASRLRSVATGAGGGNLLLNVIAAAVIGGTSLFGGAGKVSSAILGALVIAGIENGMGLLNLSSGEKFIITGIVLLIAVVVDSFSRRSQKRSGLA
ncbi:MAG: hypothetical protein RLP44_32135 [Aggregatilineales bacterium]